MGLISTSSSPSASHCCRSVLSTWAVTAIIGAPQLLLYAAALVWPVCRPSPACGYPSIPYRQFGGAQTPVLLGRFLLAQCVAYRSPASLLTVHGLTSYRRQSKLLGEGRGGLLTASLARGVVAVAATDAGGHKLRPSKRFTQHFAAVGKFMRVGRYSIRQNNDRAGSLRNHGLPALWITFKVTLRQT